MVRRRYLQELWRGKDMYRVLMNECCIHEEIKGRTVDVGSGAKLASYHRFLKKNVSATVECLDLAFDTANTAGRPIDLECNRLPYADASVDTILLFNVLEHIFDYSFVLTEIKRVLKPGGTLIGAVPFLVAYHPDPHDYWRYSSESLSRILKKNGFNTCEIRAFGHGPLTAATSQFEGVLPRVLKVFLWPLVWFCDGLLIKLRPALGRTKYSLGLFFKATISTDSV